jgi:hypothetical protein
MTSVDKLGQIAAPVAPSGTQTGPLIHIDTLRHRSPRDGSKVTDYDWKAAGNRMFRYRSSAPQNEDVLFPKADCLNPHHLR